MAKPFVQAPHEPTGIPKGVSPGKRYTPKKKLGKAAPVQKTLMRGGR